MRRGMHRLPRRVRALSSALGAVLALTAVTPALAQDPGQVGRWGELQTYPVVPVSMGVTPDGKIVAWDQANRPPNFAPVPNNGPAMVLDPATGQVTRSVNVAPRQTFCSLIAALPDGRLAIIGGGSSQGSGATSDVQIYDADSKTFSVLGQMNFKRWYPGGTIDRDGNMIVAGGTSTGIERVDQLTGASTMLNSTFPANWYPDLIRTQSGSFVIEDVGDNAAAGPGRFLLNGTNLSTISNSSNLQTRLRGVRTMIGPHTMFYNSGGTSTDSLIIDASGASPTYTRVANSRFPHMTGQALTLPTGDVLAVGGNSSGSGTKGTPVMTPELYSTATNSWSNMANISRRRTYHSVAALLPDGRVWSAGSSFEEVQEPNGQFFSPPYLFRKDGSGQPATRPTATDAPASVGAGETFSVATDSPSDIAHASMIRMAATTHQVNAGQSFVKLDVTPTAGRVSMTAPSIDQTPPGYYMVFLVNQAGVPSVAPVVRIDKTAGAAPQPRVTQSSQSTVSSRAWSAFDGNTSQGNSSYSQTLAESEPFWQVDLGERRDIDRLQVRLRSDCCTERDLWVFTSDAPFASTTVQGSRDQPGVTEYRMQTPSGTVGTAPINSSARYIRIQDPGSNTQLTLSEVEMVDNQAPSVSVTSPSNGATFAAPASYTFSADASDSDGQIAKVEFFRGSTLVGTDTSAPFSVPETGVGAGTYSLTARATDSDGETQASAPVIVTVTDPAPPSGPVAAYSFDDGAGSQLTDATGNGRTGTISGATWSAEGHTGKALSFDGVDDIVTVADHSSLDMTSEFTVESWIRPDTLSAWREVILKEAPPDTLAYGLYTSSPGGTRPSAWTAGGYAFSSQSIPTGSWTHLAATYDSGTMRIYVNGTLTGTGTNVAEPASTAGALRIGANSIWPEEAFDGLIDDVRIYDRALTASEIASDRDTAVPPPVTPPSGPQPVLELKFDDASGSVARDSSGKSHDGTLSAAGATWSTAGRTGGAVSLNGAGWVTVADHSDLDLRASMTVEAWVRPTNNEAWQTVVMKEAPPWTDSYALDASANSGMNANAWVGNSGLIAPGETTVGEWTHLAFTLEDGVGRIYRNGVLVAQTPGLGSAVPSDGVLRIGGTSIWPDEGFVGLIDDVRVWPDALSAAEIGSRVSGAPASPASVRKSPACIVKPKSGRHKVVEGRCKKRKSR